MSAVSHVSAPNGGAEGVSNMAEVLDVSAPGDVDQDCAELLGEDIMTGHKSLMEDISANEEVAAQVARGEASRKYAEVDPIQAAAVEYVLKRAAP